MGGIYPYPTWTYFSIGPHVDGHLLSATPLEMIRSGDFSRVPFLAGTNRHEMSLQLATARKDLGSVQPGDYARTIPGFLPLSKEAARQLAALYPLASFGGTPVKAYKMMVSDFTFVCPTLDALVAVSDQGVTAYGYRFDYQDFMGGATYGVMHGMDIPFVFTSLDRTVLRFLFNKSQKAKAMKLARVMQSYWSQFARTGVPGDGGVAPWPSFSKASPMLQLLGEKVHPSPSQIFERCAFWSRHPVSLGW
jgi:para-nitrobenzyl esterase